MRPTNMWGKTSSESAGSAFWQNLIEVPLPMQRRAEPSLVSGEAECIAQQFLLDLLPHVHSHKWLHLDKIVVKEIRPGSSAWAEALVFVQRENLHKHQLPACLNLFHTTKRSSERQVRISPLCRRAGSSPDKEREKEKESMLEKWGGTDQCPLRPRLAWSPVVQRGKSGMRILALAADGFTAVAEFI